MKYQFCINSNEYVKYSNDTTNQIIKNPFHSMFNVAENQSVP